LIGAESPAPDRSRRVYVLWAVGFAFLAALGLFCLLVLLPIAEVRRVLESSNIPPPSCLIARAEAEPAITILGGSVPAARKLALYLRAPRWALRQHSFEGDREAASILLGHCGRPGLQRIVAMLESSDWYLQVCGNLGLCGFFQSPDCNEVRTDPEHRQKVLESLDPETRELAARALRALELALQSRRCGSVAE
jgi:hypothetical protein